MRLPIIIPALNEAAHIAATLAPRPCVREKGPAIILVDHVSSDATKAPSPLPE